MKLSDAKFHETVELLQSMGPSNHKQDKRRASRAAIRIPIEIKFATGKILGPWMKVELWDLSPRGLCISMKQAMEDGHSFILRLPAKRGSEAPAPLICRVIHCKPQRDHTFHIGAEFTGQLDTTQRGADSVAEAERIRGAILG